MKAAKFSATTVIGLLSAMLVSHAHAVAVSDNSNAEIALLKQQLKLASAGECWRVLAMSARSAMRSRCEHRLHSSAIMQRC